VLVGQLAIPYYMDCHITSIDWISYA